MDTKGPNQDRTDKKLKGSNRKRRAALRRFSAARDVIIVADDGVVTVRPPRLSPERVGWKAFGLSCLPAEWVPPFFVVDSAVGKKGAAGGDAQERIYECLVQLGLERGVLFVRS